MSKSASGLMSVFERRVFLWLSIKAELKASCYAGSWLGSSWWLLEPLLLMFVYVFVVEILRGDNPVPYGALFIYSTVLPYRWFSMALGRSTTVLIGSAGLMKQVPFPKLALPLATVLANTIHFLFGCVILFVMMLIYRVEITAQILWFPAIVCIQLLLTLGISLFLAAGTVFVRDIQGVVPFVLRLLLFVSPIFYDISEVPEAWRTPYLFVNPLAALLGSYKNILLYGAAPLFGPLLWCLVLGGGLVMGGSRLFNRYNKTFTRWI
jgi:ABC-type polysaccharide/polyol phosphate export permease